MTAINPKGYFETQWSIGITPAGTLWKVYRKDGESDASYDRRIAKMTTRFNELWNRHSKGNR